MALFADLLDAKIDNKLPPDRVLYEKGCAFCTLNNAPLLKHPKMPATGSDSPAVYILGEAPGVNEDKEGRQFIGNAGQLLRPNIPAKFRDRIRWNNIINCHPENNRDPTPLEMKCCQPRLITDIEQTMPVAIFGFGLVPLTWTGRNNIGMWRGRRFPIRVGNHVCWYFVFHHPSFLLYQRRQNQDRPSNNEHAFRIDLKNAFNAIESGLPEPAVHTPEFAKADTFWLTGYGADDFATVIDFLAVAGEEELPVGVDYETQGLRPYSKDAAILTASVSIDSMTLAFPIDHPESGWSSEQNRQVKKAWRRFLLSRSRKAVHNLSFEMEWSAYFYGNDTIRTGVWEDTMTQAYILDERSDDRANGPLSLGFVTSQYFGLNIKHLSPKMNKDNMMNEPLSKLLPYNGMDAKYHRLSFIAQEALIEEYDLSGPYYEKLRQVPTCVLTQIKGIPVDTEVNAQFDVQYKELISKIEQELFSLPEIAKFKQLTGRDYNPASSTQDVVIMLRDIIKTREGQKESKSWSTNKAVLDSIDNPFASLQTKWRNAAKMYSTYIQPILPQSLFPDGLVHCTFGTCFVDTGRLNSESPNMQNYPKRDKNLKKLRKQFALIIKSEAAEFRKRYGICASMDYGQIEARLIACASRDPVFGKMIFENYDVHMDWAIRIANRYPPRIGGIENLHDKDVMKAFRQDMKNQWTFPLFFTAGLAKVSSQLGIPSEIIKPDYKEFWRIFAGVKSWQDDVIAQFNERGYTECLNGRRRHTPLDLGQVVNSFIQGTATDVVMDGMNRLSEMNIPERQPNIMIHDDLVFWFENERVFEDHIESIITEMLDIRFPWLCVPLTVELSIGHNWCDMEEIATFASDAIHGIPVRDPIFF